MEICFLVFKTLRNPSPWTMGMYSNEASQAPRQVPKVLSWTLLSSLLMEGKGSCYKLFLLRQLICLHLLSLHVEPFDVNLPGAVRSQINIFQFQEAVVHLRSTWDWRNYLLSCPCRMEKQRWSLCRFTFSRVTFFQMKQLRKGTGSFKATWKINLGMRPGDSTSKSH